MLISCKTIKKNNFENFEQRHYNNIACVFFRLEKYYASLFYFQRALTSTIDCEQYHILNHSYTYDVIYNKGLSLLFGSNPKEAFLQFQYIISHFKNRPHIYIRMAECCIQLHLSNKVNYGSRIPEFSSYGFRNNKRLYVKRFYFNLI